MTEIVNTENLDDKKIDSKQIVESKEVEKLSDDDIKWRAKYKLSKSQLEELKQATSNEKEELLNKFNASLKEKESMQEKLIEAKLEAQAVAAGLKDIEFIKLMDKSSIKLDEKGDIQGISETINSFKARKPELFAADKKFSSSSNAPVSTNSGNTDKTSNRNAWDISKDEWKQRKAFSGNFR